MVSEIVWIPVTERLPPRHTSVLITYVSGPDRQALSVASLDYNGNWFAHVGTFADVTAWAELPKPYIKETDDE